jgi:uncharacterized protein (TIGR02145 family)
MNPLIVWRINGIQVATGTTSYTYPPAMNDLVSCEVTSDISCTSGNPAVATLVAVVDVAPVMSLSACNDLVTITTAKPFRLQGGLPIGGTYSGNGVNSVTGMFNPMAAGAGPHLVTYSYTTVGNCSGSASITIVVQNPVPLNCGVSLITDPRDGHVYPTIKAGTQCWMASNLNFGSMKTASIYQGDNCIDEKYCLNDASINCTLYGGHYQWDELLRRGQSTGGQGLCPPGWHIPTESEWNVLFITFGGQSQAGELLMDTSPGGFNALPSGVNYMNNSWSFTGSPVSASFFWTAELSAAGKAKAHGFNTVDNSVSDYFSGRDNAFSARCIYDNPVK